MTSICRGMFTSFPSLGLHVANGSLVFRTWSRVTLPIPFHSAVLFLLQTSPCLGAGGVLIRVGLFSTPWTVARQAPLSMGFPRQEYWSGSPFLPPEDLPDSGIEPTSLASPALAGGFFTAWATWEALVCAEGRRKGNTQRREGAPRPQPLHLKAAMTAGVPSLSFSEVTCYHLPPHRGTSPSCILVRKKKFQQEQSCESESQAHQESVGLYGDPRARPHEAGRPWERMGSGFPNPGSGGEPHPPGRGLRRDPAGHPPSKHPPLLWPRTPPTADPPP